MTDEEPLLVYIVATTQVVSSALVIEREEGHALKVQRPIYYISEVLSDSKTHYP